MVKKLIFALLVALCLMNTCSAIKCYSCRSTTDPRCAEKLDKAILEQLKQVDCDTIHRPYTLSTPLPITKCNKVVSRDRAGFMVSRGCQLHEYGQDDTKCTVSHANLQIENCQICEGDLCNSATGYTAMSIMALFGVYAMTLIL